MLNVPLVSIQRWVHQKKIPFINTSDGYIFDQDQLIEWAKTQGLRLKGISKYKIDSNEDKIPKLKQSIQLGGVYDNLEGEDIYSVLHHAVQMVPFGSDINKDMVLEELISREEIASTGVGNGVAIPHPRKPLLLGEKKPIIPVFRLKNPIDFNSIDNKPVTMMFLVFCPNTKMHLKMLAKLSYFLRHPLFLDCIGKDISKESFLLKVEETENDLDGK